VRVRFRGTGLVKWCAVDGKLRPPTSSP
jgi:hypothetical protein